MYPSADLLFLFAQGFAFAVVLAYGQSVCCQWLAPRWPRGVNAVTGLLFGLMAVACMNLPIEVQPGVLVDLRSLMIFLAGPFGGPLAALVAGAVGSAYRLYLGGGGALAGCGGIVTAAAIGALIGWKFRRLDNWRSASLAGVALFLTTMPWFLAVGDIALGWTLLQRFAPAYALFYVVGTPILAAILMTEARRREAEAETRFAARRFRDISEMASDWFWEMDAGLNVTYVSERLREITGFGVEHFVGKRRRDFVADAPRGAVEAHESRLARREPFRDFCYALRTVNGELRYVLTSGKPVYGENGRFLGYRGSGRDITEETRQRRALEAAHLDAQQANRAKTDFLTTMSHELRTPLTAVLGFAEILEQEIFGPHSVAAYRGYAGDIRRSALHLLDLANEVVDLSMVETRHLSLERQPCNLAQTVESAVALIRQRAASAGVRLAVHAMAGMPEAEVDARAIKLALLNLLTNAVKFTRNGGGVEISMAFVAGEGHQVVITDNGIGIAEEDLERVFQPFCQAENGKRMTREGSGLGLPLSKALIEAHGGSLALTSRPGSGTRVRITLPAAAAAAEIDPPLARTG